jgi:hypothetical protein
VSRIRRAATERIVGVALLLLGAGAAVETFRIKDAWTGARLVPIVAAAALLALGAAHVLVRRPGPRAAATTERGATGRVALVLALLAGYVTMFGTLGFLASTIALLLVLIRVLGDYRWPTTIAFALGLGLACHVVFRTWLGMPLPDGLLGY